MWFGGVRMQRLSVLFVMNGVISVDGFPGISGGDVRWMEIAKWWQKRGFEIHVLTPQAGITLCKKFGLEAIFHESNIPDDCSLKSYLVRFLKSRSIPKSLLSFEGIVYSTTEHAYDVLPALRIKEKNKEVTWAAVVHWVAPIRRHGTSLLNSVLFFVNQRIGFRSIRKKADVVLAVSENTAAQVKKIGIAKNVFPVTAGVNFEGIRQVALRNNSVIHERKYDAVFMKRFSGTKGVFDVIEIWRNVVKKKKNAKIGMIGLGSKETISKLKKMVEEFGIIRNVDFLGPIYDSDLKFSLLANSDLFILPSYEENWAIVIGEAMAVGLPVVCYDISDVRSIWADKILWVPKGNIILFAEKVLEMLNDKEKMKKLSMDGMEFVKKHDWQKIAEKEMNCIRSIQKLGNHSQQHNK